MSPARTIRTKRAARHVRVRKKVSGTGSRPRLSVYRSLQHIYAQLIDDELGETLAAASTLDGQVREKRDGKNKTAIAQLVGTLIAERAREKGVEKVVFDRAAYKYHGRVKALANAAREGGLVF